MQSSNTVSKEPNFDVFMAYKLDELNQHFLHLAFFLIDYFSYSLCSQTSVDAQIQQKQCTKSPKIVCCTCTSGESLLFVVINNKGDIFKDNCREERNLI